MIQLGISWIYLEYLSSHYMRPDSKIDFNIDIAMKKGADLENVKKSVQRFESIKCNNKRIMVPMSAYCTNLQSYFPGHPV